jgi:MFS family permease
MLIAGRAISGVGLSGLMAGGMTMIAGSVPLHKRPRELLRTLSYQRLGHHADDRCILVYTGMMVGGM